jgi:hypothetical protein
MDRLEFVIEGTPIEQLETYLAFIKAAASCSYSPDLPALWSEEVRTRDAISRLEKTA